MFRNVLRSILATCLMVAISSLSFAQYGGGGMGGPAGNSTYNPNRSYSSKGAVIGGVAAGAAVVAGLLYWRHHKRAKLLGCVGGNGDQLVSEADSQTYRLSNQNAAILPAGERVELLGKKIKDESGEPRFEVNKMSKDLGKCSVTSAQAW
jgi:hypothetical protein